MIAKTSQLHVFLRSRALSCRNETLVLWGSAFVLSLGLPGCTTPEKKHAETIERMGPPQPPLATTTTFFDQTLTARVALGPAMHPGFQTDGASGHERSSRSERHSGGSQGGMHGGMGGGSGHGGGGGHGGDTGQSHAGSNETHAGRPQMAGHGSPPRHALQVAFTNEGKETIEFSIPKVKSILGDFAVRPAQLALAPNQRGELDPMLSALVPAALDTLDVEITVRRGDKTETKTVRLIPVAQISNTRAKTSASKRKPEHSSRAMMGVRANMRY